ncbi:hypothetical protein BDSB_23440 [Burkholderia dolosa PC543]|nr:hypothetical protein BDSB_23440 [Burkholderia dolosa PC543]
MRDACFGMCAGAPYRTESWLDKIRAVRIAMARRVSPARAVSGARRTAGCARPCTECSDGLGATQCRATQRRAPTALCMNRSRTNAMVEAASRHRGSRFASGSPSAALRDGAAPPAASLAHT